MTAAVTSMPGTVQQDRTASISPVLNPVSKSQDKSLTLMKEGKHYCTYSRHTVCNPIISHFKLFKPYTYSHIACFKDPTYEEKGKSHILNVLRKKKWFKCKRESV